LKHREAVRVHPPELGDHPFVADDGGHAVLGAAVMSQSEAADVARSSFNGTRAADRRDGYLECADD
jgi:hypothetical protein